MIPQSNRRLRTSRAYPPGRSAVGAAARRASAGQQAALASLQGKSRGDLDAAHAAAQIAAHQKTLDALNAYASGGDNPKLIGFANAQIPTVTARLIMAKGLN